MIFKDVWHVFRVKRRIINSPVLGVYIWVMLHQNSFRVDTVLDGFGIEDSVDCKFLEKWPVFHDTCLAWIARPNAVWSSGIDKVSSQESVKTLRAATVLWTGWRLEDWRYKMFDSTLASHLTQCVFGLQLYVRFKFPASEIKDNAIFFSPMKFGDSAVKRVCICSLAFLMLR